MTDKLPKVIVAFDPGGTTGIATWINDPNFETFGEAVQGTQLGPEDHHQELYGFLNTMQHLSGNDIVIVTESFEFRQSAGKEVGRRGLNLMSREYIGIMRLFAHMSNVRIVQQMPVEAKKLVTNQKLDQLGLLPENLHEQRHQMDAKRHLVFYIVMRTHGDLRKEILNAWKTEA